jgi:hypothetical protein
MIIERPKNEIDMQRALIEVENLLLTNDIEVKKLSNSYTAKQRRALHLWCKQLAGSLNDAGMHRIKISPLDGSQVELNWCKDSVKLDIYKFVLDALTGKKSTEDQDSVNPSDVAAHITRHFASKGFVCPAWPSYR